MFKSRKKLTVLMLLMILSNILIIYKVQLKNPTHIDLKISVKSDKNDTYQIFYSENSVFSEEKSQKDEYNNARKFEERIKNAENSFNFELSNIEKGFNLSEPEGKTEFLNKVAERLTEFEEELERENYIAAVAEKYFVSKETLTKLVNKIGGAKEIRETYREAGERIKKNDRTNTADEGLLKTNRFLLSIIADKPEYYHRIKNIVSAQDFVTPLYKDVAGRIFAQIEEGRKPNVAEIISRYESGEDQALVAAVFEEKFDAEVDEKEREKAFKEIVIKVRRAGLAEEMKAADSNDAKLFTEITKKQRELNKLDF